jgi:exportin-2 (importin alpha re-exporter)
LQRLWDEEESATSSINVSDRNAIKGQLVTLMCATPDNSQRQLSEALTIISRMDFPTKWPTLLSELVHKLAGGDITIIIGVLEAANSIFKR